MSREMSVLFCFVLVLGLSSTAGAWTDIDDPNYNLSFEYDVNFNQLRCHGPGDLTTTLAWNDNEVNFANPEIDCANSLYGEPTEECGCKDDPSTDGMIKLTMGQWGTDSNLLAWQTLDPAIDGNTIILQDYEYRVYFDTFKWQNPSLDASLYYGYIPDNNSLDFDVNTITTISVSASTVYQNFMLSFIAEGGQPYIGEPLGIRFLEQGQGWYWIDDVRVQFRPLTKAREPEPAHASVDLPTSGITLRWAPGMYVADNVNSHEVYFGTDKTAVEDANTNTAGIYRGNASGGPDGNDKYYYTLPDTLPLGQRCYWRVDEVNEGYAGPNPPPNGRWEGDIWSFRVTGTALSSNPAAGATDVPVYTDLSWTAGTGAQKHDVYFGTDVTAVTNADTSSGVYLGRQTATTVANSSLVPAPLLSTNYYWRIDEVNETSGLIVDGDIWGFTTAEYTVVEDFDSYVNTTQLLTVWKDYWANDTGAQVSVITVEDDVEDGNSIEYSYDSSSDPYYSEAYADVTNLGIDSDWTLGAVEALRLAFKGTNGNAVEDMYVAITDGSARTGKVIYDGDPNDIAEGWKGFQEWNIELTAFFDDNSVDLTDVQRLTIGFGDKTAGGEGMVYFDNIRLYPPRCVPQLAPSMGYFRYIDRYTASGSFTPDCTVDNYDLRTMAGDWLISGLGSVTATTAGTANLVGHWPMDDDDPQMQVDDVSGNNNHGTLFDEDRDPGRSTAKHSVDPGAIGTALSFDGVDDYVEIPALNLDSNTVTVSAWVRPDDWLGPWGSYPPIVASNEPNGFKLSFGSTATYEAENMWMPNNELAYFWTGWSWEHHSELIMPPELWSFVALVVEPTKGTLYLSDGTEMSASVNYEEHVAKAFDDLVFIGGNTYIGAIDDVRIYNRSLAPGEILDLAGLSGTHDIGLEPWRPDANGDDTVNLKDYAVTADNWLEDVMWP